MDSRAPVSVAPGNPGHFPFPNSRECKRLDSQRNREQLTAVAGPADQHCARAIQQVTAHSRRMGRQRASALRRRPRHGGPHPVHLQLEPVGAGCELME